LDLIFEVFTAPKIQVEVLWVVTACSAVVGYQHFRGPLKCWYPTTIHDVTTQKTSKISEFSLNIRILNILRYGIYLTTKKQKIDSNSA